MMKARRKLLVFLERRDMKYKESRGDRIIVSTKKSSLPLQMVAFNQKTGEKAQAVIMGDFVYISQDAWEKDRNYLYRYSVPLNKVKNISFHKPNDTWYMEGSGKITLGSTTKKVDISEPYYAT